MFLVMVTIVFLVFIMPMIYNMIKIVSSKKQQHENENEIKQLNKKRIRRIIISGILLVIITCLIFMGNYIITKNTRQNIKQEKFDKIKWGTKEGNDYPYRNNMLKNLVYNQKLKGLKKEEVMQLLGEPSRTDSNYLFYTISRSYFGDLPVPFHTKTLVIKLNHDTVEWRKIHE